MKRATLAVLALLILVTPALARWNRARGGPLRLKIYGFVGAAPDDVAPTAKWRIDAGKGKYDFIADKIEVLTGDASYMDVVEALAPYVPAFRLNGQKSAIETFTNAKPKERLVLEGVLRFGGGARIFMLDTIGPAVPATPFG
jgi:hypothetical protein